MVNLWAVLISRLWHSVVLHFYISQHIAQYSPFFEILRNVIIFQKMPNPQNAKITKLGQPTIRRSMVNLWAVLIW